MPEASTQPAKPRLPSTLDAPLFLPGAAVTNGTLIHHGVQSAKPTPEPKSQFAEVDALVPPRDAALSHAFALAAAVPQPALPGTTQDSSPRREAPPRLLEGPPTVEVGAPVTAGGHALARDSPGTPRRNLAGKLPPMALGSGRGLTRLSTTSGAPGADSPAHRSAVPVPMPQELGALDQSQLERKAEHRDASGLHHPQGISHASAMMLVGTTTSQAPQISPTSAENLLKQYGDKKASTQDLMALLPPPDAPEHFFRLNWITHL